MAFPTLGSPGPTQRPGAGLVSLRREPIARAIERGIDLEIRQQQANELSMIREKEMQEFFDSVQQRRISTSRGFTDAVSELMDPELDLTTPEAKRNISTIFQAGPELAGEIVERIQNLQLVRARQAEFAKRNEVPIDVASGFASFLQGTEEGDKLLAAIEAMRQAGRTSVDRQLVVAAIQGSTSRATRGDIDRSKLVDQALARDRVAVAQQNAFTSLLGRVLDQERFNRDIETANRQRGEPKLETFTKLATQIMSANLKRTKSDELATAQARGAQLGGIAHAIALGSPTPITPFSALMQAMELRPDLTPPGLDPGFWNQVTDTVGRIGRTLGAGIGLEVEPPAEEEPPPTGPASITPIGTPANVVPAPGVPAPGTSRPPDAATTTSGTSRQGSATLTPKLNSAINEWLDSAKPDAGPEELQTFLRERGEDLTIEQVNALIDQALQKLEGTGGGQ